MKILFRQGIVSRQSGQFLQVVGDNVDLLAVNRSTTVTLAIRDTDYIHSEDNTVASAWVGPFPVDSNPAKANAYLYWDFDPLTFERTFGWTTLAPAAQSVAPGSGNTPIIGVVPTAASPVIQGSFEVSGQYVLTTNKKISVVSSTANDGIYTVQSATYSTLSGTTTILVKEAITSASISGSINLDFDIYGQPLKQTGRTWYDTANHIHYELNVANQWVEVIRVFAARLNNANSFFSMSKDANFTGSQIGDVSSVFAGRVLFAETNKPITRDDGTFFTTEDQFFTNQSRVDALRLESNVSRAKSVSGGTLAAFGIVQWVGEGEITTAQYNDTGSTVVGVLTEDTIAGEVGAVIVQGTVTNAAWSWDSVLVGKALWIKNGELVSIDPHLDDPINHQAPQVPVARVLSGDTVIFEQGLGGTGPQGPKGTITDLPLANDELEQGVVSLSHAPDNDLFPIAVGTNHPVITSGPYSVDGHGHTATEISFETIPGSITSEDVQNAIAELNNKKLSLTGGTMTGILTLSGTPVDDLDAATKLYVDTLAKGLDAKESVLVGTDADFGGTYSSTGGTGGTGAIPDADISSLDGVYGTDYTLIVGSRILVKDQTDAKENGIYVVTTLTGSPPVTLGVERAADFDENDDIRAGNYVFIRVGLVYAGTGWVLTDIHPDDDIDLNQHDIVWTLISSGTSFTTDDTTVILTGNVLSTRQASDNGTVDALQWNGNDIVVGSPPTDGQILVYNTTGGYWANSDLIIPTTLDDLSDVIVAGSPAVTNQVLTFDGSNWVNADAQGGASVLNDLSDVVVAGSPAVTNQVLTFNGSNWVNTEAQGGAIILSDLTDVVLGSPPGIPLLSGQILQYDGSDWVNALNTNPLGDLTVVSIPASDTIISTKDTFALEINGVSGAAVQYEAPQGYDTATLTYDIKSTNTVGGADVAPVFSPDGVYMFYAYYQAAQTRIYRKTLSTPWDISTAGAEVNSGSVGGSGAFEGILISSDGFTLWLASAGGTGYEYSFGTAWDVSTITFQSAPTLNWNNGNTSDMTANRAGTQVYKVLESDNTVEWGTLGTANDMSTMAIGATQDLTGYNPKSVSVNTDGTKMFVLADDEVHEFDLSVPYNPTSLTFVNTVTLANLSGVITYHATWKDDGTQYYIWTDDTDTITQYSSDASGGGTNFVGYHNDVVKVKTTTDGVKAVGLLELSTYSTAGLPTGVNGGLVYDSTTTEVKVYDGSNFVAVGAAVPPSYKKFILGGSPVLQVLDTTPLPVTITAGSPIQTANIQVFRNGILQNEDTTSGSPIDGDFEVTGPNQLTFAPDSLQPGGVIIIYVFS